MSRSSMSLQAAAPPTVAVAFASQRVTAASVEARGANYVVRAHAIEPLSAGALVPSLTAPNIHDRPAVMGALTRVLDQVGRSRRIGVVIPDPVAKVSLIKFQQVPGKGEDL